MTNTQHPIQPFNTGGREGEGEEEFRFTHENAYAAADFCICEELTALPGSMIRVNMSSFG